MIVLMHLATGGLAGGVAGSRLRAAALGPLLHLACDAVPHEDIPSRFFETASGIAALLLLTRRRGLDATTVGAAASAAPDLEHVLPLLRPRGRALFPTHRWQSPVHARCLPAWIQLTTAIVILARLCRHARIEPASSSRTLRVGATCAWAAGRSIRDSAPLQECPHVLQQHQQVQRIAR